MMTSVELRWFWRGRCPQPVYDWFFKSGLPLGGGQSRVDRYIPQRGEPHISLKRRGEQPQPSLSDALERPAEQAAHYRGAT
jgi:hypothetical protein